MTRTFPILLGALTLLGAFNLPAQEAAPNAPGKLLYENRCARCHGADGKGGERGPAIVTRIGDHNDRELAALVRTGLPGRGMPPNQVSAAQMPVLTRYLRTLQPKPGERAPVRETIRVANGATLSGEVLNRGFDDLQLRTGDQRIHLMRRSSDGYREVTSETGWAGYNGEPGGNRYTALTQIKPDNVARLGPKWIFSLPDTGRLQVTPVVADGVMYVTSANECYALDAGSGRQIWHYKRAPTKGLLVSAGGINRGAAIAGDRVFMEAEDAHLLALNRSTGALVWESRIADWRENYFSSSAPLVAGNAVVAGVSGGEHGAPGYVVAFDQETGKELWRFRTVPRRGEPGSETWNGKDIDHGGAPTWFTGTWDPQLETVFWPVGNPGAEYNGDNRPGDNLYSDSILALDVHTGKLKWYFQFTPHDLWDYDSTETPVLVDAPWQGQPRKLLLHADRNGFFYIFDRTDGKLLLGKRFARNLTWASGLTPEGRPIRNPNMEPSAAGTKVCPSQAGATNWYSPSFSPLTGLYYIQSFEMCSVYTKREAGEWAPGKPYLGGSQRGVPGDETPVRELKAIDIQTGNVVWTLPQPGPAESWGGTLTTATGLVFLGEENGAFMAVSASSGKPLWRFETNQLWKASPMTYTFDGRQYIAVAAGSNIISFGLLE
jgi:alcohol dehydrogenase (cytochrome c)